MSQATSDIRDNVTIKGSVALKIIQHIAETPVAMRNQCGGALLGVPTEHSLMITNCFPYVEDTIDPSVSYKHMKEMYNEVFPVGWYIHCHYYTGLADIIGRSIFRHQKDYKGSVILLYDHNKSSNGALCFRALRLTNNALSLVESGKFSIENLYQHKLNLDNYFEELNVSYINSTLTNFLLAELAINKLVTIDNPTYLQNQQMDKLEPLLNVMSSSFDSICENLRKTNSVYDDKCMLIEKLATNRKYQAVEQEINHFINSFHAQDKRLFFNAIYTTDFYNASLENELKSVNERFKLLSHIISQKYRNLYFILSV